MRTLSLLVAVVALSAVTAHANILSDAVLITPDGVGSANGWQNTAGCLDAQPADVPLPGVTTDDFGEAFGFYTNAGRGVYIDFGPDYANLTIEEVWLGLKQFGTDPSGTPLCFWSEQPDEEFDGTDVAAPNFLFNWVGDSSMKHWQQVWTGNAVPAHQYYIMTFDGTQGWTNRSEELVFAGQVPEPGTLALLGLGVIGLLRRKR